MVSMDQLDESKISDLTVFLAKYFAIIFFVLIIIDVLKVYPLTLKSQLFRYTVIGLSIYSLFFVSYLCNSLIRGISLLLRKIALESAIDVTFIIPIILILTNRRKSGRVLTADSVFLLGGSLFLIIFLSFFIFSEIVYSIPCLLNSIAGSSGFVFPNSGVSSYPNFIIIHNMIFLSETFLGSFFLLIPTFGAVLFDTLITAPITVYLIRIGQANIILPQLLLELLGTYTATATSFTIFHTFFTSMSKKVKDSVYLQMQSYAVKIIVLGLALSIYAFLLAGPIESALLYTKGLNTLWYRTIYLFDIITIIIYVGFFYDILKRKVFPLQQIILPSLSSGLILFVALAGGPTNIENWIPFLMLLAIVSLMYPLLELRKAFLGNKIIKRLNDSLKELDCFITPVQGRSMYPTITAMDYVINLKVNEKIKLSVGDIITFEPPLYYAPISYGRFVTHRIIDLNENQIRTKGDNLQKPDPPIKYYRIFGIAIGKCDHSFGIFEPLTKRPELIKVLTRVESLIRAEESKTDTSRISVKTRSLLSIIFVIVIASVLPYLFLMA